MSNSTIRRITGLGAITGYGWGTTALWRGLTSAKPAARLVAGFGTEPGTPGWVVTVDDHGFAADGATPYTRAIRGATREAIDDALAAGWQPGRRVGLVVASVLGDLDVHAKVAPGSGPFRNREYVGATPSTPLSRVMSDYGFHGPALSVSAMCTSGVAALLTAKMWLDADIVDDVVVVAADLSARPEVVRMFVQLGVAVTDRDPFTACRPFQSGSAGFTFGEAAVAFVVSGHAETGGYGDILGGAMSHDGHHATSVDPSATHVQACVADALASAGVAGNDIAYLNAHGPGTRQCDAAEAQIANALVPGAEVFSVKPLVGHCQAAAGAVEVAVSLLAFSHRVIPAPPRVADSSLRQLLGGPTPAEPGLTLKTSLGMGGHNGALVLAPVS